MTYNVILSIDLSYSVNAKNEKEAEKKARGKFKKELYDDVDFAEGVDEWDLSLREVVKA